MLITPEEIKMIDYCRNAYAVPHDIPMIPCEELLLPWKQAKFPTLYTLLGNNLILTRHLEYSETEENLKLKLSTLIAGKPFGKNQRKGDTFAKAALKNPNFNFLFNYDYLLSNIYSGPDKIIPLPNGKTYTVRKDCKTIKALEKLAAAFELPGFEDFRICHSQILNQKNLSGDLTLSIHPLDYITMSDNNCDWKSCMNWKDNGAYRRGTVEMMNSPTVVVAYLSSEDPFQIDSSSWNNKKWRQLFAVDKNVILGVKAYPYQNSNLTSSILEWLRQLAADNLSWTYGETKTAINKTATTLPTGETVYIDLSTEAMYNDWGCLDNHQLMINPNIPLKKLEKYGEDYIYNVEYSGPSQCMACGSTDWDTEFVSEEDLVCRDCTPHHICSCCGNPIFEDEEWYVIDGEYLCRNCFCLETRPCDICGEDHLQNNLIPIYAIPELITKTKDGRYSARIDISSPDFYVCDDCLDEFVEKKLKENCHMFILNHTYHCIYFDDLLESVKKETSYWADYDYIAPLEFSSVIQF